MGSKEPHQGKYTPRNPLKYKGDPTNIIYRSSWERLFMKWCDSTRAVLKWGSEEVVIPYQSPIDNQIHQYYVDFVIEVQDKTGVNKRYLIEIKPSKYIIPPLEPKRKTRRYLQEVESYIINQAKWKAATAFAGQTNAKFMVLTEVDLGLNGRKAS